MCGAVYSVQARSSAPFALGIGRQDDDAHEIILDSLVGKVLEGLAAIAMEEDVEAQGTRLADAGGGTCDARACRELRRRAGDLVRQREATAVSGSTFVRVSTPYLTTAVLSKIVEPSLAVEMTGWDPAAPLWA